jgi:hypothetical protein
MSVSADVHSLDALKEFRATLCQFGTDAADAMCAIELQIHRMFDWLQDQYKFWQRTIREVQEEVVEAKAELAARKFPNALGRIPDCTVQEEALEDALRRLEEAEEKCERVRRWSSQLLPYAVTEYEGPARQMQNMLEAELIQGIALLDRKIVTLEEYIGLTAPSIGAVPMSSAPQAPSLAPAAPVAPTTPSNPSPKGESREPEHRPEQAVQQPGGPDPALGGHQGGLAGPGSPGL